MTRSQHQGSFLIVEGKAADLKVYKRFVDLEACQVIPAHGKANATGALEILESDGFEGVLATVDSDFSRLEGKYPESPSLILTDTHDLETMILKSSAAEKLLIEFGSPSKVQDLITQRGKDVLEILLESGRPIGYLRWASQQRDLALDFKNLTFSAFVDRNTLTTDVNNLVREVKNKSRRADISDEELCAMISDISDTTHDPWHVCCGHDLVQILSVGLRSILGTNNANEVKAERLEKDLRIAYESSHFFDTRLYRSLREWEAANTPFRLFPVS